MHAKSKVAALDRIPFWAISDGRLARACPNAKSGEPLDPVNSRLRVGADGRVRPVAGGCGRERAGASGSGRVRAAARGCGREWVGADGSGRTMGRIAFKMPNKSAQP